MNRERYGDQLSDQIDELRSLLYGFLHDPEIPSWLKLRNKADINYCLDALSMIDTSVSFDQPLSGEE